MTTAPALKSSRDRSTIRPVGVPPSSKTRNALNDFISYQLPLEGPGFDFRRALEILEIEAVHAVDDSRVGARGGFEPGPRHGLRRLAIGVEVHHSTLTYHTGMEGRLVSATVAIVASLGAAAPGQLTERPLAEALTHPAIEYASRPTTDPIVELNRRIDEGAVRIAFDEGTGYLRSVLEALNVPIESQMLV